MICIYKELTCSENEYEKKSDRMIKKKHSDNMHTTTAMAATTTTTSERYIHSRIHTHIFMNIGGHTPAMIDLSH